MRGWRAAILHERAALRHDLQMTQSFRRRALTALALAASILPASAFAQAQPAPISESEVRAHIAVLASDEFEGRGPGSAGETKTLDYLAKTWASYGLVSGTNDAARPWFQPVPLVERKPYAQAVSASVRGKVLKLAEDGVVLSGRNPTDRATGEPLYVGHGVGADGKLNADVKGRIVLMLSADPKFEGAAKLPGLRDRQKLLAEAGAAAVLITAPDGAPWGGLRAARQRIDAARQRRRQRADRWGIARRCVRCADAARGACRLPMRASRALPR